MIREPLEIACACWFALKFKLLRRNFEQTFEKFQKPVEVCQVA